MNSPGNGGIAPSALFTAPGVPPTTTLAAQLAVQALAWSGSTSSSEGPPPAGAVGHGVLFE